MENLLRFKKELQEHQDVNRDMVKWAERKGDKKSAEKWRSKETECDYILFLINDFIEQKRKEIKSSKVMKKTDENLQKLNNLHE